MPHLRDYGYEAGWGVDDAPCQGVRSCFGADRDDERCRDESGARDDACAALARAPDATHEKD